MQSYGFDQTSHVEGFFIGQVDVFSSFSVNSLYFYRRNTGRQSFCSSAAAVGSGFTAVSRGIAADISGIAADSSGFAADISGIATYIGSCTADIGSCTADISGCTADIGSCTACIGSRCAAVASGSCCRSCSILVLQNNGHVTSYIESSNAVSCTGNRYGLYGVNRNNGLFRQLFCNLFFYVLFYFSLFSIGNFQFSSVSASCCTNGYLCCTLQQSSNISRGNSDLYVYASVLQAAVYRCNAVIEVCTILCNHAVNCLRLICSSCNVL